MCLQIFFFFLLCYKLQQLCSQLDFFQISEAFIPKDLDMHT